MKSMATSKPSATAVDRWTFIGALALAAYFLVTNIYISGHRLFWYDEVFTTLTTRMPDWSTIWRAVVEDCTDPSPFGYFVVARTFDKLFGPSEIGIRLPSALAMAAGMLLTYDCARRATDRLHGLIAMAVLTCSYLTNYGFEGRAYALYFLFAAAALWVWIGKHSAILLAAVFFFGVQIHYYLVLCLVPFAAEEAYNWRPWRRPSARILGGVLGALAGMAILLPQILGARRIHGSAFWAQPSGRDIPAMFTNVFPAGLFLVAMATLWVVLNDRCEPVALRQVSAAERTGWFALTIPIAGYVLAKLITHAFLNRYFIGLLPGAAVGFSCLLWRRFPAMPRIPVGVLLLFAGYGVATQTLMALHPDQVDPRGNWAYASIPTQERIRAILAAEEPLRSRGIRYIAIDSRDLLFLEARYYSKHPECYVWWSYSATATDVSRYYPARRWTSDEIKQHAREAVLVDLRPDALEAIQRSGIHTAVHKSGPLFITFPE
jgi:Dolichyl-phosphate-mannose-protein mannosyltransferase